MSYVLFHSTQITKLTLSISLSHKISITWKNIVQYLVIKFHNFLSCIFLSLASYTSLKLMSLIFKTFSQNSSKIIKAIFHTYHHINPI